MPTPEELGETKHEKPEEPTETKPDLPADNFEMAETMGGMDTELPDQTDLASVETEQPKEKGEGKTRIDDLRERVALKLGRKKPEQAPYSPEELESSHDGIILALENDPESAKQIDLAELEFEYSDDYPEAKARQEKLRQEVRKIGTELFRKNPEAFAKAFDKGTDDLIPRNERIAVATMWAMNPEQSQWDVAKLMERGILTPEEGIGVIERMPAGQQDTEMAKVFKAEPGEPLYEMRESLERMGEFNQANIDFLKQMVDTNREANPDLAAAYQERLDNLMDLMDTEPESAKPLDKGINAAELTEGYDARAAELWAQDHPEDAGNEEKLKAQFTRRTVRKPRISEHAYGTEYMSVRMKAKPGESASRENLAQNFALMMNVKCPEVALQSGPNGTGSVQRFEGGARMAAQIPDKRSRVENDPQFKQQAEQLAALDYIISNSDRHLGNYMETADGELMSIDKGLAFCDKNLDMDEIKDDLTRELGLEDKYKDVKFEDMDDDERGVLANYASQRMFANGLNSHPLQLLHEGGAQRFSQETMRMVEQVKTAMESGKDSPLYKMFELTFGENADKQWERTKKRVEGLIASGGELPKNAELFENMWKKHIAKEDKPEQAAPSAENSEIATADLKAKKAQAEQPAPSPESSGIATADLKAKKDKPDQQPPGPEDSGVATADLKKKK